MNKRIRKKQEKQRKQLEMKWLLDMAVAIDTAIQEYWQWREEMERHYVELYTEKMGETAAKTVTMLSGKLPFMEGAEFTPDVSRTLDSSKVSDHHAIIPTMELRHEYG